MNKISPIFSGTNFSTAILNINQIINEHKNPQLKIIIVFLTDGECGYD